jgi:cell wall-associated NlpC family hydrolase
MLRRAVRLVVVMLFFAAPAPAHAASLGLAEVLTPEGVVVGAASAGGYAYPADGSILRIGSARATPGGVEVRDVTLFNGRVFVDRIVVPARGLVGAHVEGLVADGKAYRVAPNTVVPLAGGSYLVALQEAVAPGRNGSGLVGLRAYVADASLGIAPGTQLLVGMARAARPSTKRATAPWMLLGLGEVRAENASLAGVRSLLPGSSIGAQAATIVQRFLGIPYVWAGADPEHGFDCSGLTMYVYGLLGIKLYHYSGYQWYEGTRVPRAQLEPGDLVFFHMGPNGPGHEGMYIGGGLFVQAPHTGDVVKISSLDEYAFSYVGAVRPYGAAATLPLGVPGL